MFKTAAKATAQGTRRLGPTTSLTPPLARCRTAFWGLFLGAALALLPGAPALAQPAPGAPEDAKLRAAIDNPARSERHRARDKWRHPYEVLTFFGIRDDMTVVEIWPGRRGWWTAILEPYLEENGRYVAIQRRHPKKKYQGEANFEMIVSDLKTDKSIRPEGGADMVLTFRNLHNWMKRGHAETALKAFYGALKPGGILGVVDHRDRTGRPQDPRALSGYVRQDVAIRLAEAAGFVLDGVSEANANPRDTTDHPEGVWTMPPSLRLGARDREKYLAIGESDRFTLRFRKPTN